VVSPRLRRDRERRVAASLRSMRRLSHEAKRFAEATHIQRTTDNRLCRAVGRCFVGASTQRVRRVSAAARRGSNEVRGGERVPLTIGRASARNRGTLLWPDRDDQAINARRRCSMGQEARYTRARLGHLRKARGNRQPGKRWPSYANHRAAGKNSRSPARQPSRSTPQPAVSRT
jgi:hypothetical protein